jgi:E3 ubiquitin-protein ligase MYCBP2
MNACLCVCAGFPKTYTAVKCGTSGHNVRVAPSLDATAIGMVVVGNQLTATREVG